MFTSVCGSSLEYKVPVPMSHTVVGLGSRDQLVYDLKNCDFE